MLIYGDGEQTRAFTYVGDIMRPLWNAAILNEASKQIINLGGTQEYTINKAAEILCNITGYDNIEHKEPRHEVKWAVPTYQKSIDILGYENEHTLEDGLYRSWEWAKKQPNRL